MEQTLKRQEPGNKTPSHQAASFELQSEPQVYDRNFLLAFLGQICFVVANTLLAHYARWIEHLGGDLRQVGWIMGFGFATGLVLRPVMAQFINVLGAKRTWGIGYVVFTLSSLANWLLDDLHPSIYLIRTTSVLGTAIVFASGLTYISQVAPESRRTEAIGTFGIGGFLGMFIGPFLGDLLLGQGRRDHADFYVLFGVAAVSTSIPLLIMPFLRSPMKPAASQAWNAREFIRLVRRYWPGRVLAVALVFGTCMTVPFVFLVSYMDDYDAQLRISGVAEVGFFFWFYAGFGILFRVLSRRLPERIGARPVLLIGMLTMAIGLESFVIVTPSRALLLCIPAALCGLGHSLMFHTMTSLTLQSFPVAYRGTGSVLALMMLDLGTLVSAPVLGVLGQYFGYQTIFLAIAVLLILTCGYYAAEVSGKTIVPCDSDRSERGKPVS